MSNAEPAPALHPSYKIRRFSHLHARNRYSFRPEWPTHFDPARLDWTLVSSEMQDSLYGAWLDMHVPHLNPLRAHGLVTACIVSACMTFGCAPASSIAYNRHLRASSEPTYVNSEAMAEARQLNEQPADSSVLAGALSDQTNDHR